LVRRVVLDKKVKVQVDEETRAKLKALGRMGETYDYVIKRLIGYDVIIRKARARAAS
jgi:hypothetical protein